MKGHGTENDFVLLPDLDGARPLTAELAAALCDRRAGIGGDGVLRVVRAAADPDGAAMAADAEWFMDYRNADGSAVEMCGNGIRVFARYLVAAGLARPGTLSIATRGGVRAVRVDATGDIAVDLGPYGLPDLGAVLIQIGPRSWPATAVTMPNPHAVVMVEDLAHAGELRDAPTVGPAGAYPHGVNVELVVRRGPRQVAMRVHERGVGETRSCGTGAAAGAVAAALAAGELSAERPPRAALDYRVDLPGGTLAVSIRTDGRVDLAGPAVLVGSGVLDPDWLRAATAT